MKTCKDCEHWKQRTRFLNRNELIDEGDCECPKMVYGGDEKTPIDGLSSQDAEDYSAWITTGPNFGCIHWLEKVVIVEAEKENQKLLETK